MHGELYRASLQLPHLWVCSVQWCSIERWGQQSGRRAGQRAGDKSEPAHHLCFHSSPWSPSGIGRLCFSQILSKILFWRGSNKDSEKQDVRLTKITTGSSITHFSGPLQSNSYWENVWFYLHFFISQVLLNPSDQHFIPSHHQAALYQVTNDRSSSCQIRRFSSYLMFQQHVTKLTTSSLKHFLPMALRMLLAFASPFTSLLLLLSDSLGSFYFWPLNVRMLQGSVLWILLFMPGEILFYFSKLFEI